MSLVEVIGAVLPALLVLAIGFYAGRRRYFEGAARAALNTLTLRFALPAALFVGVTATPRDVLFTDGPLLVLLVIGLLGVFALALLIHRFALRLPRGQAAVLSLAVGFPAFAFMGIPILGALFGPAQAVLPIGVAGIVANAIVTPLALALLGAHSSPSSQESWRQRLGRQVGPLREPVAWAPLLGLICVLLGLRVPAVLANTVQLLGNASSAVALLAVGVTVAAMGTPRLTIRIAAVTVARLLVVPLAVYGIGVLLFGHDVAVRCALVVAFPVSPLVMMLAAKHVPEEEHAMASTVVFTVLGSIVTLPVLVELLV